MRGQILKDPIFPKAPTTESLVQIISNHSPPHPKMTEIFGTAECEQEIKENLNNTSIDLPDVSNHRDEIVHEHHDSNVTLVPHKSTWINSLADHLWQEQKMKKDYEEDNSFVTLQKLLFQLYGQHLFAKALWKEEKKKMSKIITSQNEEIEELEE